MHKVEYLLKPEHVDANEQRIKAVFAELHSLKPPGLRYACFRGPDGRSVMHVVVREADGGVRLPDFATFKTFSAGIGDICEVSPQRLELQLVGAYGFLGD